MLRTSIRRVLALRDIPQLGDVRVALTPAVADTDNMPTGHRRDSTKSACFTGLSGHSPGGCGSGDRVVGVIDGLEIMGAHSTHRPLRLAVYSYPASAPSAEPTKGAREQQSRRSPDARATRRRCTGAWGTATS
ncbi:hypothetical protein DL766_010277 [Monosporascus sp. MC13-8B]|uniref:Uncharacterized protein n=1 Tax=Monosporascus cannonballus TaxID=155416 RepID=A0ABY0GS85_9PEZI|nr:hypothetical protein DL762_009970 [Monosporascus cannonballus]RYO76688.1 hypothetical protein DL763_010267 [Monosporascus cannonballus]RYP01872.1 hypothetical protein DL766_010277 [Monosporascus sp. MC13-8B]